MNRLNNNSFAAFASDDSDEEDVFEEKQFHVDQIFIRCTRYQEPVPFSVYPDKWPIWVMIQGDKPVMVKIDGNHLVLIYN